MRIMTSDELKEAMKESPRRYTNPFLTDEENEKVNLWNNQELEHSNIKDDSTNNCEDENFRKSLAQCNVPSEFFEKETELYTDKNIMECELPEFLVCYKENAFHVKDICVDEGIPHGERILFDENNHEILCISSPVSDGNNDPFLKAEQLRFPPMEDYLVESNSCSGTNGNVDTGLPVLEPTNDHMDIGDNRDEDFCKKSDASSGTHEVDTDLPSNDSEIPFEDLRDSRPHKDNKDCEDAAAKECGTKEEVIDSVVPNELKNVSKDDIDDEDGTSDCAPDKLKLSPESDTVSKATENNGPHMSMEVGEEHINSRENLLDNVSKEQVASDSVASLQQDRPLPSLKSLLDSIKGVRDIDQQCSQTPVEQISKSPVVGNEAEELGRSVQTTNVLNESVIEENNTSNLNNGKSPENVHKLSIETQGAPNHQDAASNNVAIVNPVQRGEGESSFSVAGPVSGLITYSGPIAFSGSVSLRSDSSTTSTRSFAFPILQSEWNSSPVRMAKADRRRLQKHRGWKHGLLCCRF